jgi:hypothetical protein
LWDLRGIGWKVVVVTLGRPLAKDLDDKSVELLKKKI